MTLSTTLFDKFGWAVAVLLLSTGCALMPWHKPTVKVGDTKVSGPANAGTAPEIRKLDTGTTLPLAAGSKITVTETAAQPATPERPATPAVKVVEIVPSADTTLHQTASATSASAGTVDTSVAKTQIRATESRPLLYAAITSALAAGFFVWRAYPTPALACGIASGAFFAAWRLTDLPTWFWAVGAVAVAFALALYLGHERGEKFTATKPTETPTP